MPEISGCKQAGEGTEQDRKQATRFKPGQSGNPSGRAKGVRDRATVRAEQLMQEDANEVVEASSIKLRAVTWSLPDLSSTGSPRRGRDAVEFDLPVLNSSSDVVAAQSAVIAATAQSELTPDEAASIAGILEIKRKALEQVEIETRLAALEKEIKS